MPLPPQAQDVVAYAAPVLSRLQLALRWASSQTGLPVVVVAAMALVGGWRLLKHSLRFAIHVVLATVALVVATELGLLRW